MSVGCFTGGAEALSARSVIYRYRYCARCRREWSAERGQCPECLLWLGETPLERVEWQLAPSCSQAGTPMGYENIGTTALCLRLAGPCPTARQLDDAAPLLAALFRPASRGGGVLGIDGEGWLLWSSAGIRQVFLEAVGLRDRLAESLPALQRPVVLTTRVRWGIWVDDCVVPVANASARPCIDGTLAKRLFDFEPDNLLLVTEAVFRANRRWEHFVGIPARRRGGIGRTGFRPLGRKQPSALDHARTPHRATFVGRAEELGQLDAMWRLSKNASCRAAIIAPAGAGKTRLVNAWLDRHADARWLHANFSIFGGDLAAFAGQLVALPEASLTRRTLVERVVARLHHERVNVLVLDDLHWADAASWTFLRALLNATPGEGLLTLVCARPTAAARMARLRAMTTIHLPPLPPEDAGELAQRLGAAPAIVAAAARLAHGNPLYVEQLVAWADESHHTDGPCPTSLHEVVLARIAHLGQVRLRQIRERASWSASWMRADVVTELDAVEAEIGLWLDRLESSDYADREVVAFYLGRLQRVESELFLAAMVLGRARPRSTRLGEAIERLLLGSADHLLASMTKRVDALASPEDLGLAEDAERAGVCAKDNCRWSLAQGFYEIARRAAPAWRQPQLAERLTEIRRLIGESWPLVADREHDDVVDELQRNPSVDPVRLPEIWLRLGQRLEAPLYYRRAVRAAKAIGATGLRDAAQQALAQFPAVGVHPRPGP